MPQPKDDLSRSLVALEQDKTLIAVVELSSATWLVGGMVPGIQREPLKKLAPDEEALLALLHRWRDEAIAAGQRSIPRKVERKPERYSRLPLHDRIVRFRENDPEPAKLLLAIKVIGNVGTHGEDITFNDLLTGYEILDHVIDLIYSGRAGRIS